MVTDKSIRPVLQKEGVWGTAFAGWEAMNDTGGKIPRKLPGFVSRMLYATSREMNTSVLFPNCHCGKTWRQFLTCQKN